jgi:hypothetical protein
MNAVTRMGEAGEQHFKGVQNEVLSDELKKEGVPEEKTYSFIIDHAPLFRFFATHLPDEMVQTYDTANKNEESRKALEEGYEQLCGEIKRVFAQHFDADTQTALADAAENGDIAVAERILEVHFTLAKRTEE